MKYINSKPFIAGYKKQIALTFNTFNHLITKENAECIKIALEKILEADQYKGKEKIALTFLKSHIKKPKEKQHLDAVNLGAKTAMFDIAFKFFSADDIFADSRLYICKNENEDIYFLLENLMPPKKAKEYYIYRSGKDEPKK